MVYSNLSSLRSSGRQLNPILEPVALAPGGTRERGIVDVDLLEESGRPGCRLDRFQDDGFTLASNGDDVPFELKSFGQFHQLSAVGLYDLGNFHGISHSEKEP